jgi:hypothetical protein
MRLVAGDMWYAQTHIRRGRETNGIWLPTRHGLPMGVFLLENIGCLVSNSTGGVGLFMTDFRNGRARLGRYLG